MKKKRYRQFLFTAAAGFLLVTGSMPAALSYLTDKTDGMLNPFTIALDCTSTVVEKYPIPGEETPNTPVPDGNAITYDKAVQVGNTGYVDEYIRVQLTFSDQDIAQKSQFSWDGSHWYSVAEYKDHLPEGWAYNTEDDFYYYTPIVYADRWSETAAKLTYDKNLGEYFYPNGQDIISERCITTPLFRYVRTVFSQPKDMRSYSLHVYNESVPFYFGNNYAQSWDNYLAIMTPGEEADV